MKSLALVAILLASLFSGGISVITHLNQYAAEAATAYNRQDYIEAIAAYKYLLDDLEVDDDQLRLNLAHSYYQAGLLPQATDAYQYLADHPTTHLRALAHLQLGNINTRQKKYKRALALYKQALVAEPGNNAARYNYELLKKYLALHPEAAAEESQPEATEQENSAGPDELQSPPPAEEDLQPQPKKKPDEQGDQEEEIDTPEPDKEGRQQQNAGAEDKEQGEKEREDAAGEASGTEKGQQLNSPFDKDAQQRRGSSEAASDEDQQAQTRRARLRQANMSPEKARLLLDAMRNAELQYIQQLPKKSTRQPDPTKPDW
ncbi:aerotolerance protein [Pontibacter anaerobius]|uniref:Aerotolerance protein n=1 Tax=Pontibacter anaerobius TaxID=2993940 RepID=A0ABT3RDA2_9BACT|nr:aerotolerance protein [Pontibacter anaerobius]MCX2739823.1 aerotolerance protein [Pontibacter anaerobius]